MPDHARPVPERRRVVRFGLAGLAIVVLSFLPLAVNEVTTNFSEINAALDYIRSGGDPTALGPLVRFLVIGARVVSWPLTGLFTDAAVAGLIATAVVIAIIVALARFGTLRERQAARWLGLGLLWTAFALTIISPSLATVIPGLPNDHYHAFADPMVFTLVGLGAGALWRVRPSRTAAPGAGAAELPDTAREDGRTVPVGPAVVVVALAVLIAWNLVNQPPAVHPDGGFPAAETAGARILAATGADTPITLRSLPDFKSTEAYAYPLHPRRRHGRSPTQGSGPVATSDGALVVICDSLFEEAIGAPCGGPPRRPSHPQSASASRSTASWQHRAARSPSISGLWRPRDKASARSKSQRHDPVRSRVDPCESRLVGGWRTLRQAPSPGERRALESALQDLRISSDEAAVRGSIDQQPTQGDAVGRADSARR